MKNNPAAKGSLLAALDIGSSKIACFIVRALDDEGTFEVLGVGNQPSKGIKSGSITDMNAAETVIRQTVHAAENMAAEVMKGYPLRDIILNVPSVHSLSHSQSAELTISGHEITDNDVRRALVHAQNDIEDDAYELVHTIPVNTHVDDQENVREPRGMVGEKMNVDIHLVTGEKAALRNIASAVEHSHLDITAFCDNAYAAGLAALVEDEIDLGSLVIDIGGGVTSFAVFQDGALIHVDAIPVGGQHVTNDIAKGLTTSIADAERIKILYGSAMGSGMDEKELIDVPKLGEEEGSEPNHVPRSLLVGIIQPRIEEIFELIRGRLKDSGLANPLGRRIVVTGGSSQLHGLGELAQHVLDKQIRVGRPIHLRGLPDAMNGPAFATTAGMLTYVAKRHQEMPSDILAQVEPGNLWEGVKSWLKENW